MGLSELSVQKISSVLKKAIREKIAKYKPETDYKPFHHRLLGRDRYAMFSFIHSMNTSFGTSIWEPVAVILAQNAGYQAEKSYKLLGEIDNDTETRITEIIYGLQKAERNADKNEEIKEIRRVIKKGKLLKHPNSNVDLHVKIGDLECFFDIKTVKPNAEGFEVLKKKLLRWVALKLSQDRTAKVFTGLALPYNPYHPKPYKRWTLKGLYDLEGQEVLVGKEFWNYIGGGDVYQDLLNVFQQTGEELRPELNKKFSEFK